MTIGTMITAPSSMALCSLAEAGLQRFEFGIHLFRGAEFGDFLFEALGFPAETGGFCATLGEIDPALNSSADPNGFDMLNYDPKYWLINGKSYPSTQPIFADPGDRLLLRYANAGLQNHTMQLIGYHQTLIAGDSYPLQHPYEVVAQTIASGQTFDVIGTLPTGTPPGTTYALYSAQEHITNSGLFPGGMLTFVIDAPLGLSGGCTSTISMSDALLIARRVVGLRLSVPCYVNADLNRDGRITMGDALGAARAVVGLSNP